MNIGHKYQDGMDKTRTVVPIDSKGTCRVFFDGKYVGKATIPIRLFEHPLPGFSPKAISFYPANYKKDG